MLSLCNSFDWNLSRDVKSLNFIEETGGVDSLFVLLVVKLEIYLLWKDRSMNILKY